MKSCPEIGQLVVVRKRPFVVTEIVPSATGIAPNGNGASHLIRLSSVEDDGLGEELQVIWEIEYRTWSLSFSAIVHHGYTKLGIHKPFLNPLMMKYRDKKVMI